MVLTFFVLKMLIHDVYTVIFNYVNDGKTYKSILYSSKTLYDIMVLHYPQKRYQVYNQLWSLIELYPDKPWDWSQISANPSTTIDIINKHATIIAWYWSSISMNKSITMDIIKQHIHYPWNWTTVSQNPNLTIEMIREYPDKMWCWSTISKNKAITMDMIKNNLDLPWKWDMVGNNPNITMDMIDKYPQIPNRISINKHYKQFAESLNRYWYKPTHIINPITNELYTYNTLTMDVIHQYPNYEWDWQMLSIKIH